MGRAVAALGAAGVPYAVVGGHAVAAWVEAVGVGGVRATPGADFVIRRADRPRAWAALQAAGFVSVPGEPVEAFRDGWTPGSRAAVRVLLAGERVRPTDATAPPDPSASVPTPAGYRVVRLPELVAMKLTAFRRIDRVHLRDMAGVGLLAAGWAADLPPPLGERLQAILDDPDG